jgi:hypothetical protein
MRAGGVAQVVKYLYESKPQYHPKNKKEPGANDSCLEY